MLTELQIVSGGWKGYIFSTDSGVEEFLNVHVEGSESSVSLKCDWNYTFLGEEGEGYDNDSPDSMFVGTWANGAVTNAIGSGMMEINQFWFWNGRQCARGTYMWPDGETGVMYLTRP